MGKIGYEPSVDVIDKELRIFMMLQRFAQLLEILDFDPHRHACVEVKANKFIL